MRLGKKRWSKKSLHPNKKKKLQLLIEYQTFKFINARK